MHSDQIRNFKLLRAPQLALHGDRTSGQDVRQQNTTAVLAVANILKSSLGPVGLDKMLVDDIGDVTITNDGATILKLLEVEHPAARMLVELAEQQDADVGDGTTSVVLFAAELLKRGSDLVRNGLHPTSVLSGFRLASREAVRFVESRASLAVSDLGRETLLNAARTSMSSKVTGAESDIFSKLAVDAVLAVGRSSDDCEPSLTKYPVKAVNILKAHGASLRESALLDGYALNLGRAAQGMPRSVRDARIACLDMNLQRTRLHMGVQILVTDPAELEKIRARELDVTRERIQAILKAGANVVLTTKGIDDAALKYFVEAGAIAARRVPKDDLKRVARATGATLVGFLADEEGGETFDASCLGRAEEVVEERISDSDVLAIRRPLNTRAVTVLLRGANDYLLDEVDRSLHDALCTVKRVLESGAVVPGGGCVEASLSVHLEKFALSMEAREQMAVAEFAQALLVVPKTLAVNAAQDATDLVARLRAAHAKAQAAGPVACRMGLDLEAGELRDSVAAGVVEPALSKVKILQFATEAAITILRIDDLIRVAPDPEEAED
ncbi:heat shock protein 60 Hsp60 [Helicosporidium sp. ATCC 50920]|nr:heat shock protein 60 Hsp60 [Helicosporidium sp. ATCC 50920]|eukprot:KDD74878.1 heat shock protein 60 Hsp60 [Helicosporidium sp. ATCC 50920]